MLRYGFGIESTKMCRGKVAMQAFIEALQAQIITLSNGGRIQSENFIEGRAGFKINHDGDAEFNNGKLRGHIEADSGELNNVTIKEQAVFLGTINSGPVFISNENTTPVVPRVFSAGTSIADIRSFLGGDSTFNINGSYGGRTDLISIITATVQNASNANDRRYSLCLIFSSGTDVFFEDTVSMNVQGPFVSRATISQQLSIGGSASGKIFIIANLPIGGAGLPPGTVYRQGNQLMIA
jgi:hypothetical protein